MTHTEIAETKLAVYQMVNVTLKSLIVAMVSLFGLLFLVLSISTADASTLKPVSVINDDFVRLSDVFTDVGNGETVLGRAPQPGKDMVLSARTLNRLAVTHNVDWRAQSLAEQVTLRRDAHTITSMDLENVVKTALDTRGIDGSYNIKLSDLNAAITLPRNIPATAEVTNLTYTPGHDVFIATVSAPSASNPVQTLNVSGTIERTVQIPVLKSTMKNGDIIGSTDIEWVDMAQRGLAKDVLTDADDLIGKTPARLVTLNQPVRIKDVASPQLVSRGDEVTIIVKEGGMQLTAKGKAMQNGAEGDIIRAINTTSNRSLTAMVTGDRTITVQ